MTVIRTFSLSFIGCR